MRPWRCEQLVMSRSVSRMFSTTILQRKFDWFLTGREKSGRVIPWRDKGSVTMLRFLAGFTLVVSSVFGAGVCQCPPSIIAVINGTNYSSSFNVTPLSNNQGYNLSGAVNTD